MTVTIRHAIDTDIPAIVHLHIEGWKGAYGGLIKNEFLEKPTLDDRITQWKEWIHDESSATQIAYATDNSPIGFVSYGRLKTPPPGSSPIRPLYSGEIYGLYILPSYYRCGIGTRLIQHAAHHLITLKHRSFCLWVLEKNTRAVSFYKKMDGERYGKHDIKLGDTTVREICFGWRHANIVIPPHHL